MDINISETERNALDLEKMAGENREDVLHRLIAPLVDRGARMQFSLFVTNYKNASLEKQLEVLTILETIVF